MMFQRAGWLLAGLLLALGCYHLPWYAHDTAGFTMHGYDLAEWASLHPAVRGSSPPMLTSFLLRAPLWALLAALALTANGLRDPRVRWIVRVGVLLLALRFVPPKDFFTTATDDPNYRQMLLLALLSAASVGGAMLFARAPSRLQTALLQVVLVLGIISSWWGLSRAGQLLHDFEIDVRAGAGFAGYTLLLVALVLLLFASYRRASGERQMHHTR